MRIITLIIFILINSVAAAQDGRTPPTLVEINAEQQAIDLKNAIDIFRGQGDTLVVATAPDANGVVRRIEVRAINPQPSGNWLRFAIANTTDTQIDRLLVVPHFRLAQSGILNPNLGKKRIHEILPSEGFKLDRQIDPNNDIFRMTLNPDAIVTFVAELTADEVPQIILWEPDAYKDAVNSYRLYEGIIIGIAGLLALFLTIIFIIKGEAMFPTAALLAWSVLAYVCVEFGFLAQVLNWQPDEQNIARAGVEVLLVICLAVFVFAYLHLNRWHAQYSYILGICLLGMFVLAVTTIFDPELAAGIARVSFAVVAGLGLIIILFLAIKSFDRAILLTPTWIMVLAWGVAYALTVQGEINNDVVQHALAGALVLILLLVSFTVLQYAFAGDAIAPYLISNVERQAVALAGSGATVWDWEVDRDEIFVGREVAKALGLRERDLNGSPNKWLDIMHPQDRDKFRIVLDIMIEQRKGKIKQEFRLKTKIGDYKWWRIEARPMIAIDGEVVRCIGVINDVTNQRVSENRLLYNAVFDNLTKLPNKEIFRDRVENTMAIAKMQNNQFNLSIFYIDVDKFSKVRSEFGDSFADLVLLTLSTRIVRFSEPQDCLARIADNQFGLLVIANKTPEEMAKIAERIHANMQKNVKLENQQCEIKVSIGIATWTKEFEAPEEIMKNAEIAMYQAKQKGGGNIEVFNPTMISRKGTNEFITEQFKIAIQNKKIKIIYQPIIHIKSRKITGFEAIVQWNHPVQGYVPIEHFNEIAEHNDLTIPIGNMVVDEVVSQMGEWNRQFPKNNVFVAVNIDSQLIINSKLIAIVKTKLRENNVDPTKLKLEIAEKTVMENPQNTIPILQRIREIGVGISVDKFGEGYSSIEHLGKFSFDTVKTSATFLNGGSEKFVVLKYIIAMAHDLKLHTIADGVEDEEDFVRLRRMGCQYVQGTLFGEPFSTELVTAVLNKHFGEKNNKVENENKKEK